MSTPEVIEAIPVAEDISSRWVEAADFLEQAGRVGKPTPEALYMLAMCYKNQGKLDEARATLRKITPVDANILLQLGILSFLSAQYEQADEEFSRSLEMNPHSYAAMYNLVLCRFSLGRFDECVDVMPKLIGLARSAEEKRFLALLHALICTTASPDKPLPVVEWEENGSPAIAGTASLEQLLASATPKEEMALVHLLQGFPRPETALPLFQQLVQSRPNSPHIQRAYLERALVQARQFAQRCAWYEVDQLLSPLSRMIEASPYISSSVPVHVIVAFWDLLGCCACMLQDFDRAIRCFHAAIQWNGNDAWLYQNLALAYELQGRLDQAEMHWNRYFDLLDQNVPVPPISNYLEDLAFAGLNRLSEYFQRIERWSSALTYVQRAHRLRPRDLETLERLFNLYVQLRRPEDARRTLRRMREINPGDPQFDLYELDLREVRSLEDLDRMLADVKQILSRYPGDMRVEDRALNMVANCVPMIGRRCDQLSEQLAHIVEQVRRLPNYKIDWRVVHDEMHYLRHEFQKLRRLSNKCLAVVTSEEHRRIIKDLNAHIDSKIDICISMGG